MTSLHLLAVLLLLTPLGGQCVPSDQQLASSFLARLGLSEDDIPSELPDGTERGVPEYGIQLYQMFRSIDDQGLSKDLSSHILMPYAWEVNSGVITLHFSWHDALQTSSAYQEFVAPLHQECVQSMESQLISGVSVEISDDQKTLKEGIGQGRFTDLGPTGPGYLVLNITTALNKWLRSNADRRRPDQFEIRLDFHHFFVTDCLKESAEDPPILVVHSDPEIRKYESETGKVISAGKSGAQSNPRNQDDGHIVRERARRSTFVSYNGICAVRRWRVRFVDLGWDSWIVQPNNFEAAVCAGDCSLENSPLTSHAYLRMAFKQKVNSREAGALPDPVCASTKMAPMSVLHYGTNRTLTVKLIPDMVITGCACI